MLSMRAGAVLDQQCSCGLSIAGERGRWLNLGNTVSSGEKETVLALVREGGPGTGMATLLGPAETVR